MIIAFDADVVIYAATKGHVFGPRIGALFSDRAAESAGLGSVLLLTEVLAKPMREDPDSQETAALVSLLSRLRLLPVDEPTARLSLALASRYGLRAADAAHLATAVGVGAEVFLTNNRRDFPATISEIDIVYPAQLPGPS